MHIIQLARSAIMHISLDKLVVLARWVAALREKQTPWRAPRNAAKKSEGPVRERDTGGRLTDPRHTGRITSRKWVIAGLR